MKKIATPLILILLLSSTAFSQSKSYSILKEKFRGYENVVSINTSGFLTRTILTFAGEHAFNKAIKEVRHIRLTVIPKKAFRAEKVTVKGFLKVAKEDSFEELFHVNDYGEEVTLLVQSEDRDSNNRYLLMVDSDDEVVAMEIRGYIDYELLYRQLKRSSHYQQKI